ncbi:MAG: glucose-1-phosphate cytidylyltransferase [Crenarchaeota archaeon]|nr:MAG: glucose-1-phosphate cytidylyltransferase [Thermoproteota archaeon]RDJ33338.1 MAG: glucose-1-phosphate cytidylyltransferase [Thermoproteota archaeon]RDJ36159.1 MAG: glucose-1-phosphate cytidylyltransferase [Thermoproteota archaeon]RDJ38790.1 MAG: glucose-1-phosphate cytidylyltransferase [Thermoproteota archaeon]
MKAVILAGGFGTRISEETHLKPKPLIEIGGMPILWHIMKIYSHHNVNEFVICCGYKGYMIKEFFANYFLHTSDVTIDIKQNKMDVHRKKGEPWKITLIDTGLETMTGGRLKKVKEFVESETFCFTYGDGISDIDISKLVQFHKNKKTQATVTVVQPPGRFGMVDLQNEKILSFKEKPAGDGNWINGGYFVLEPTVFDYIKGDSTVWEKEPVENLAKDSELSAYKHTGFWQPLDTLRDKIKLDDLWVRGIAPWKKWD